MKPKHRQRSRVTIDPATLTWILGIAALILSLSPESRPAVLRILELVAGQ